MKVFFNLPEYQPLRPKPLISYLTSLQAIPGYSLQPTSQTTSQTPRIGFNQAETWLGKRPTLRSYLPDWLFTLFLWCASLLLDRVKGFQRQLDLNDTSIAHSFSSSERVPVGSLIALAVILPACSICSLSYLQKHHPRDIHHGLLGLLLALSLTTSCTQIIKVSVGRPRPDMLERCVPVHNPVVSHAVDLSSSCSADLSSYQLIDGFRSFPSGHSSTAWAGLGFLFFYGSGKFKSFKRPVEGSRLKSLVVFLPLFLATWISISRTMDYRHHWEDVTVGGLLGFLMSWFSYRTYYPSLMATDSETPFQFRFDSSNAYHLGPHQIGINSNDALIEMPTDLVSPHSS